MHSTSHLNRNIANIRLCLKHPCTLLGKYRKYERRQNKVYFHSDTCKYFTYHVHLFSKLSSCYLQMYGWTDTAKLGHASLQVCDVHSLLTPFSWHPSGHSRVQWTTGYVPWQWPHIPKFCMKLSSKKVGVVDEIEETAYWVTRQCTVDVISAHCPQVYGPECVTSPLRFDAFNSSDYMALNSCRNSK
jgi:hypothetical protein